MTKKRPQTDKLPDIKQEKYQKKGPDLNSDVNLNVQKSLVKMLEK